MFGTNQNTSIFGWQNKYTPYRFGSPSLFGAMIPAPGANTSIFGGASTAPNVFGTNTSTVFGQTSNTGTGGFSFGGTTQPAGGGLFGQNTAANTTASLFATPATSAFGAKTPAFGGTTGAFGSTPAAGGLFGNTTSSFGATNTATSSLFGGFGAASQQPQQPQQPGTTVKFNPPPNTDTMVKNGTTQNISTRHQCITAMKEYENKSLEELRAEDYAANRKGPQAGSITSAGLFGGGVSQSDSTAFGGFGAANKSTGFGFGSAASSGGLFGSTQTPAQASTSLFGASKPSLFGTPATTTAAPSSLFGAAQPNAFSFGATNPLQNKGLFGAPATTQSGGLFGTSTPAASTGAFSFGSNTAQNCRSPEEIVRERSGDGNSAAEDAETMSAMQKKLELTTSLCHTLMRDQQALNRLLKQSSVIATSASPDAYRGSGISPPIPIPVATPTAPDQTMAAYTQQLIQQQMQLGLQQCQQLIYQQQMEIRQLNAHMMSLSGHHDDFSFQSSFLSPMSPIVSLKTIRPRLWGVDGDERAPGRPATDPDSCRTQSSKRSPQNVKAEVPKLKLDAVVGRKYPAGERASAAASLASKMAPKLPSAGAAATGAKKPSSASAQPRPGLSAMISGTSFLDDGQSSQVSSIPPTDTFNTRKRLDDADADLAVGLSLFEALRENIYSEVASLISQNEGRPHYLVELFRELQLLTSDYLRQRALYALKDLVSNTLSQELDDDQERQEYEEDRFGALSEGLVNAGADSSPLFKRSPEGVATASLDTQQRPDRGTDGSGAALQDQANESSESESQPHIDTRQLDSKIKSIMTQVIPILKTHMEDTCSADLLSYMKTVILALAHQRGDQMEHGQFFHKQLARLIQDTLIKYQGRKMMECVEDLVVDISEILFSELAFYHLMKDLDDPMQNAARKYERQDLSSVAGEQSSRPSASTGGTGAVVNGQSGGARLRTGLIEYESTDDNDLEDDDNEQSAESALSGQMHGDQQTTDLDDTLDKERDDEMAGVVNVDDDDEDSGDDDGDGRVKTVQLSVSETKPYNRIGSDEDDEGDDDDDGSLEDECDTAVSRDVEMEATLNGAMNDVTCSKELLQQRQDGEKDVDEVSNLCQLITENSVADAEERTESVLTLDDLPVKLDINQTDFQSDRQMARAAEESAAASLSAAVDEALAEAGYGELAGDDEALAPLNSVPTEPSAPV